MSDSFGLSPTECKVVADILNDLLPCEAKVFVFGSRARGSERPRSDLDLAVDYEGPLSREIWHRLLNAFEDSELPMRVDIVDIRAVSPTFLAMIKGEWRLFKRDNAQSD